MQGTGLQAVVLLPKKAGGEGTCSHWASLGAMSATGRCSGGTAGLLHPVLLKCSPCSGHRYQESPDHCLPENMARPEGPRSSTHTHEARAAWEVAGAQRTGSLPSHGHCPARASPAAGERGPTRTREGGKGGGFSTQRVAGCSESPCAETGGGFEVAWGWRWGPAGWLVNTWEGSGGGGRDVLRCAGRAPRGSVTNRGAGAVGASCADCVLWDVSTTTAARVHPRL